MSVRHHDVDRSCTIHLTVDKNDNSTNPRAIGYASCRCNWRSKVFYATRSEVMYRAKEAFKMHRPPWWMRWLL